MARSIKPIKIAGIPISLVTQGDVFSLEFPAGNQQAMGYLANIMGERISSAGKKSMVVCATENEITIHEGAGEWSLSDAGKPEVPLASVVESICRDLAHEIPDEESLKGFMELRSLREERDSESRARSEARKSVEPFAADAASWFASKKGAALNGSERADFLKYLTEQQQARDNKAKS